MFYHGLYGGIAKYSAQAVYDLSAKLPEGFALQSIIDLGCRMGDTTKYLAKVFPTAKVVGVDSSDAMLEQAQARIQIRNAK